MSKIAVVYWSGTGNTEAMANAIAKGITDAGKEAECVTVANASLDSLKEQSVFALGCSATGAEALEETEMDSFVTEVEAFASGKQIALFGSYGWGDGEWMRDWVERMKTAGAIVVNGEGLICNEAPDDEAIVACEALGAQLAGL